MTKRAVTAACALLAPGHAGLARTGPISIHLIEVSVIAGTLVRQVPQLRPVSLLETFLAARRIAGPTSISTG